jgi:hypothetical protein
LVANRTLDVAEPQVRHAAIAAAADTENQMQHALAVLAKHVLERAAPSQAFAVIALHAPAPSR